MPPTIRTRAACHRRSRASGRFRTTPRSCRCRACSSCSTSSTPATARSSPTVAPCPTIPNPAWTGYSSARWEGDALLVNTLGFRDDLWLDMAGNPLTAAARVRERIRRPNFGRLEVEFTVDDPNAYTRPWTATIVLDHAVDSELVDEICLENEKSFERMQRVKQ